MFARLWMQSWRHTRTFAARAVNIVVDGKTLSAPEDTLLIDVLRSAKIRVPTLCYNPRLKTGGHCKVCMVEDLSRPGVPVMSCRTPVKEGMSISTTNPVIKAYAETNKVLTLRKHPAIPKKLPTLKHEEEKGAPPNLSSVLSKYPRRKEFTLPLGIAVADKLGYIGANAVEQIAAHVGEDKAKVSSVLIKYKFLPSKHTKQTHIYLCTCHNCRLKSQPRLLETLHEFVGDTCEVHTMNWLGVCINGPPAAMVKVEGTNEVEYLMDIRVEDVHKCKEMTRVGLLKEVPDNLSFFPFDRLGKDHISLMSDLDVKAIADKAFNTPANDIIQRIEDANLRGCGGAGFPTFMKWKTVSKAEGEKYVVCNGDEGLPCAFKDGWLLRHKDMRERVVAGMHICARTVGSRKAYLYIRYEYRNLVNAINETVREFRQKCQQYADIEFEVRVGAGTYIAGEETALLSSIQGDEPIPQRNRPWYVHSTESGLFGKPTVINNVETFAHVPYVLSLPLQVLKASGLPKLIGVVGDVKKPCLLECSLDKLSLQSIIDEVGALNIENAEVGGATEPLVARKDFSRNVSFRRGDLGAVGSVVLFNKERNVKEIYSAKLDFMSDECCGQCYPCREGSRMFCCGYNAATCRGEKVDTKFFGDTSASLSRCALCGHGKALGKLFKNIMDQDDQLH